MRCVRAAKESGTGARAILSLQLLVPPRLRTQVLFVLHQVEVSISTVRTKCNPPHHPWDAALGNRRQLREIWLAGVYSALKRDVPIPKRYAFPDHYQTTTWIVWGPLTAHAQTVQLLYIDKGSKVCRTCAGFSDCIWVE